MRNSDTQIVETGANYTRATDEDGSNDSFRFSEDTVTEIAILVPR